MRLVIVQYGGDYRASFQRLATTGIETYHAQKYVIGSVCEIGSKIEEATLLCCQSQAVYNEVLQPGLRAIGAGIDPYKQPKQLCQIVTNLKPTHLVIHTPITSLFLWAIQHKVKTLGLLADSFLNNNLRQRFNNYLLAKCLNSNYVEWVGNHGINACISLQKIGVNPDKIIPWDWPHVIDPSLFLPKELRLHVDRWNLVYVGALEAAKGVGDIIAAIAKLRDKSFPVKLQVAGSGNLDYFYKIVNKLQVEDCVEYLGLIPHNQVINLIRQADAIIVPSRPEYPEGFPLTIYEAFCARTPLIASNHPMFKGNLQHGVNAMIFPARNVEALTGCIEKLLSDPQLYYSLSTASKEAWQKLQLPVKWGELINKWLHNSPENQRWLFQHRLGSELYK